MALLCVECSSIADVGCAKQCCKECCGSIIDEECPVHKIEIGTTFSGIIDGEHPSGYFVTTLVGNVAFKGILFKSDCAVKVYTVPKRPAGNPIAQPSQRRRRRPATSSSGAAVAAAQAFDELGSDDDYKNDDDNNNNNDNGDDDDDDDRRDASPATSTSATKKRKVDHQNGPRRNVSAYVHFVKATRTARQEANRGKSFQEISKALGQEWREMSDEAKLPFIRLAHQDKERYETERAEWDRLQSSASPQAAAAAAATAEALSSGQ